MSTVICVQIKKLRNLCSPFDIHGAWMPDGVIATCQIHVWLNLLPYWGIHIYLLVTCDLTSFLKFCTSSSSILKLGLPCSNTHHFVHLLVPFGILLLLIITPFPADFRSLVKICHKYHLIAYYSFLLHLFDKIRNIPIDDSIVSCGQTWRTSVPGVWLMLPDLYHGWPPRSGKLPCGGLPPYFILYHPFH